MTPDELLLENRRLRADLGEERLRRQVAEAKVKDLLRRLYGASSEKVDPRQHELALESVEADRKLAEVAQPQHLAGSGEPEGKARPKRGSRRPIPENLPVERVVHDLPEDQKVDALTGEPLVKIRKEITEEIDYRPSQFVRVQHVVPVYAAPNKSSGPVQAKIARVIPGSGVGTGLLSHILVSRFTDHLPYYRQEQMALRQGVILERQKMSQWVEHVAVLLKGIVHGLEKRLLASGYVQCDETPVRVLDPERAGAARQAYLWVRHAPGARVILFDFEMSRRHEIPLQYFPEDWVGVVQSDGYGAYDELVRKRPGITLVHCWAHARRKWTEAVDDGGGTVAVILANIARLYRVEAEARDMSPADREGLRRSRSEIILAQLHRQISAAGEKALPSSGIGQAADYALKRWSSLTAFVRPEFGHVLIDSNPIENGIRPSALGKKNWMFVGHPEAGWKSAVAYSVMGTCKLLQINPEDYLNWVLPRLAAGTNRSTEKLLPHDYLSALKEPR